MKTTFAIACLLGLASAGVDNSADILDSISQTEPYSYGPEEGKLPVYVIPTSFVQVESDSESSDSEDDHANLALDAYKVIEKNPTYNAWESVKDGAADGKYERIITPNFSSDSDDIFMRSMITKYAHEKRTSIEELDDGTKLGGEPTGVFMMGKKDMFRASKEVMGTHKGLSGDALSSYLDTYFDKAWENFDVNSDGAIEVIKAPQFMRFLASDQSLQLGESG